MRLTTKGRFAVTAMIDVAMHCAGGPVTLGGVSERQKISLSYLEQLFGKLRRHGIVESVRGPGGGYNLARPADSLSVADIILAVDTSLSMGQETAAVEQNLNQFASLITSAGIDEFASFTDITAETWDRMIAVNLTGVWLCMKHEIAQMLKQGNGGSIVNCSSILGRVGFATKLRRQRSDFHAHRRRRSERQLVIVAAG